MLLLAALASVIAASGVDARPAVALDLQTTWLILPGPLGLPLVVAYDLPLPVQETDPGEGEEDPPPPPPPPPPPDDKDLPPVTWGDVKMIYA